MAGQLDDVLAGVAVRGGEPGQQDAVDMASIDIDERGESWAAGRPAGRPFRESVRDRLGGGAGDPDDPDAAAAGRGGDGDDGIVAAANGVRQDGVDGRQSFQLKIGGRCG